MGHAKKRLEGSLRCLCEFNAVEDAFEFCLRSGASKSIDAFASTTTLCPPRVVVPGDTELSIVPGHGVAEMICSSWLGFSALAPATQNRCRKISWPPGVVTYEASDSRPILRRNRRRKTQYAYEIV
jgi:hypothetical protein